MTRSDLSFSPLDIPPAFLDKYWPFYALLIAIVTAAIYFSLHLIFKKSLSTAEQGPSGWKQACIHSLHLPFKMSILLLGLYYFFQLVLGQWEQPQLRGMLAKVGHFVKFLLSLWTLFRLIKHVENRYMDQIRTDRPKKTRKDPSMIRTIAHFSRLFALLICVILYLQSIQINLSALLAVGGAGGLIAGFAAKDLLANFLGALMLYIDRPFSVGDLIRSSERNIEGFVESIGWRITKIRTLTKTALFVPSGIFSTIVVENRSKRSHRRIKAELGVRYQDASKLQKILTEVEAMLKTIPTVDSKQPLFARFNECRPSSLNLLIQCFTKKTSFEECAQEQQDILLKVIQIIKQHGAQCAYPTTTLHLSDKEEVDLIASKKGSRSKDPPKEG